MLEECLEKKAFRGKEDSRLDSFLFRNVSTMDVFEPCDFCKFDYLGLLFFFGYWRCCFIEVIYLYFYYSLLSLTVELLIISGLFVASAVSIFSCKSLILFGE